MNSADSEAFHPEPVVQAHRHRVLAINMTHGNLEAFAGEMLAANGVVAQIDRSLGTIRAPAVVIQVKITNWSNRLMGVVSPPISPTPVL